MSYYFLQVSNILRVFLITSIFIYGGAEFYAVYASPEDEGDEIAEPSLSLQEFWLGMGQEKMEVASSIVRNYAGGGAPELQDVSYIYMEAADALMQGQEAFTPQPEVWSLITDCVSMASNYTNSRVNNSVFMKAVDLLSRMDSFDNSQELSYDFWKNKAAICSIIAGHGDTVEKSKNLYLSAKNSLLKAIDSADDVDTLAMAKLNLAELHITRAQLLENYRLSKSTSEVSSLLIEEGLSLEEVDAVIKDEIKRLLGSAEQLLDEVSADVKSFNPYTLKMLFSVCTEERLTEAFITTSLSDKDKLVEQAARCHALEIRSEDKDFVDYIYLAHLASLRGETSEVIKSLRDYAGGSDKPSYYFSVLIRSDVFLSIYLDDPEFAKFVNEFDADETDASTMGESSALNNN